MSLTSGVKLHIRLLFSSLLQLWYFEVRISRSVSESPLEFEITGVDCILITQTFLKHNNCQRTIYKHEDIVPFATADTLLTTYIIKMMKTSITDSNWFLQNLAELTRVLWNLEYSLSASNLLSYGLPVFWKHWVSEVYWIVRHFNHPCWYSITLII